MYEDVYNQLTEAEKYDAVISNNQNYDSIFFYAVKSTGIYCRPSCKSKAPKVVNIEFFRTSSEALNSGYRPCKRCRSDLLEYDPIKEIAEQMKVMLERAFESEQALNHQLIGFGVSKKRLVQIFKEAYGITPTLYVDQLRLSEAKRMLRETDDKVIDIAYAIGFNSLSSFYTFFKKHIQKTPTQYRQGLELGE